MDYFDIELVDKQNRKFKRKIIFKLDKYSSDIFQKQGEDLCQVLDYSPREIENEKELEKITFKSNNQSNENLELKKMSSSFNIDIDNNKKNENENLPENEQIIRDILNKIINDIFKEEEEENESDEEYDKLIYKRNKKLEKNNNINENNKNKFSSFHSLSNSSEIHRVSL